MFSLWKFGCVLKDLNWCTKRTVTTCGIVLKKFNEPLSANSMPRGGGIASMMRLPIADSAKGLDACFLGVPLDTGTSYKSGSKMGPRFIRVESAMIRQVNIDTGAAPFESLMVADISDVPVKTSNLLESCRQIREHLADVISNGCIPMVMGGDHTISYPILQAMKDKYGPVGLIHLDAHSDTMESVMGEKIANATPFRRAVEDGCLDTNRVIQIGLRGSGYSPFDYDWARKQGFRLVLGQDCWGKSLEGLMVEVREMMGDKPVYISFDIDAMDPSYAPGTGVPEIAGLTPQQALQIIRGCRGLNIVGADVVEVLPSYDAASITSIMAANLLFEILCVLPGVKYYDREQT
ncbi:agmatinase, mitochondrial-like [Gigantopelta aegis]|uniref:agmatinase, mitochondrial-like n=1 Tax=Gigantopelta aegis TaxID=1735272 RepID=UPI001B887932|nr:agmatinase, mitochondrial-like [Gigantopelta aegis]